MLNAPLFGTPAPTTEAKPVVIETVQAAPKPSVMSRLKIKLLGTVVAGARSAAIVIMPGSGKQQLFFLHDTLQPQVTLETVEARAITINHQGTMERIELESSDAAGGSYVASETITAPPAPMAPRIQQRMQRSYLNQQIQNLPQLLNQARAVPHFNQGKLDGFMITTIAPGSLYQKVGLQNGDILRKVNGQSILNAEQAMRMYQSLQQASNIDLEIQRGGSIVPIHYTIQ